MTHQPKNDAMDSLDALEREMAEQFHGTAAPADPWRDSRMLAKAAQIPSKRQTFALPYWLAGVAVSALAAVTAFVVWFDVAPPSDSNSQRQPTMAQVAPDARLEGTEVRTADENPQPRMAHVNQAQGQVSTTASLTENGETGISLGEESLLEDEFMATASFALLATLEVEVEPEDGEALVAYLLSDDSEEDETW